MDLTAKKNLKFWSNISKDYNKLVTDILRPTKQQLEIKQEIIKKYSQGKNHLKGLVLGSTPEFRDLLISCGFQSYAVDHNPDILKAMSKLMTFKNHKLDKQIKSNWLEMDFSDNYFDLILGDVSFNQIIDTDDLNKLLTRLKRILKPGGLLISRELVMLTLKPDSVWSETIERYQKGLIKRGEVMVELRVNSDLRSVGSPQVVDGHEIYLKLKEKFKQGKIPHELYERVEETYSSGSKMINIFLKEDWEKILSNYFELAAIKQPCDYYSCKYMPLFFGVNNK